MSICYERMVRSSDFSECSVLGIQSTNKILFSSSNPLYGLCACSRYLWILTWLTNYDAPLICCSGMRNSRMLMRSFLWVPSLAKEWMMSRSGFCPNFLRDQLIILRCASYFPNASGKLYYELRFQESSTFISFNQHTYLVNTDFSSHDQIFD